MKTFGDTKRVLDSAYATDASVTLHEDRFLMSVHVPAAKVNCIAVTSSDDGLKFPNPRIVLRPDPKIVGATRGLETPSPMLPPVNGFPFWSMFAMGYGITNPADHDSCCVLAYADDPMGFWKLDDIAVAAVKRRQQPTENASNMRDGGVCEFSHMLVGDPSIGLIAALYATNSYRPKPCIYAAASLPPWTMRSWAPAPDPAIEGEGALWASQPHLSMVDGVPVCVYAEGPPERVRVARGTLDLSKWTPGEVLVEPNGDIERCVGPCLVSLGGTRGRLYYTAVSNQSSLWSLVAVDVDLTT